MKIRIAAVFLVLSGLGMAQEKVPTCRLGSDYAVDLHRQLAPGEEITTDTGGVATVAQKEKPWSTHIVFRRCVLPKGTEVVIGSSTPWVKVCGNALIQTEGWMLPLVASQKTVAVPQVQSTPASSGDKEVNVVVHVYNQISQPEKKEEKKEEVAAAPPPPKKSWARRHLPKILIIGGVAAVGGYLGARAGGENKPSQPAGFKDQVVIIRTGP